MRRHTQIGFAVAAAALLLVMVPLPAAAQNRGLWENNNVPYPAPLVPVAVALVPSAAQFPAGGGKVVMWSAFSSYQFNFDTPPPGSTAYALFDIPTRKSTALMTAAINHDMFCPGTSQLADGTILVVGGSSSSSSSFFDPVTLKWSIGPKVNVGRGYSGDTTLSNGRHFLIGGSWSGNTFPYYPGNKPAEVFTPTGRLQGTWRTLPNILDKVILTDDCIVPGGAYDCEMVNTGVRRDNHAWVFALPDGWVFHAGPSKQMNYFNTAGAGTVVPAGVRAQAPGGPYTQQYGIAIPYHVTDAEMKVICCGGTWTEYPPADVDAYNVCFEVTVKTGGAMPPPAPTVRRLADMTFGRAFLTGSVLPDGKILVTGGQKHVQVFTDYTAVYAAELYNPATNTWTTMKPACCARCYHSVSLLLPDATVLTGGGGLCSVGDATCADIGSSHFDVATFAPPNLLAADGVTRRTQPKITTAPKSAKVGTTITVTVARLASGAEPTIASFCIIRSGATTHTVNNDLRRIPLTFTKSAPLTYKLPLPKKSGTTPPGFYMLFAVDNRGVPSKAPFVQITL